MALLDLVFASDDPGLSVRDAKVVEGLSQLFEIELVARCPADDLALDALIGARATFAVDGGSLGGVRRWGGVCTRFEQQNPEDKGLATYALTLRPSLWLLSQRTNCRVFQHLSTPEIVAQLLGEWSIPATFGFDTATYPRFEYKVQYGESDFAFVSRLLEDAGISYALDFSADDGSVPTFVDHPETKEPRAGALPYADKPHPEVREPFATAVVVRRELAPGGFVVQDHDFRRRPDYPLLAAAPAASGVEAKLEQYAYRPGAFLTEGTKLVSRAAASDDAEGAALAARGLEATRNAHRTIALKTNVSDLVPGSVFSISGHPQRVVSSGALLVTHASFEGTATGEWSFRVRCVTADSPYRPALATPRPRVQGVQAALVVGPSGDEIHTEELGRVRVQFPWDRYGASDEQSSCFLRVSQGWAGAGYGVLSVPRVGQEVTVAFFEGDPDQPIIVGRVHNVVNQPPCALPDQKTRTAWRSQSTPNGGDGHNELVFEDATGAELISLRAERDLQKLVKQNEIERTGVDRTSSIGRARSLTVGGVDSTLVGVRHIVAIGGDGGAGTTSWEMTDKRIVATTGDATVTFDGPDLTFEAKGNITIVSREGDVIIKGGPNVKINST
jgi:type VI secretion system secreted protein VgrG